MNERQEMERERALCVKVRVNKYHKSISFDLLCVAVSERRPRSCATVATTSLSLTARAFILLPPAGLLTPLVMKSNSLDFHLFIRLHYRILGIRLGELNK